MSGVNGQPESFSFSSENRKKADVFIAKYPEGRQASAVMALLDLAQRQNGGWLPRVAIEFVADMLSMPVIRVYEVATFYTMYKLEPVGEHLIEVCTNTPCWLRGSDAIVKACEKTLGIELGATTPDGKFTLVEAECLGACVNAPMMQIGDDYYEDLDDESVAKIIGALGRGEKPKPGPQVNRQTSAPVGGATTLTAMKGSA